MKISALELTAKGITILLASLPGLAVFLEKLPTIPGHSDIFIAAANAASFVGALYLVASWKHYGTMSRRKILARLIAFGTSVVFCFFLLTALKDSRVITFQMGSIGKCELTAPLKLPAEPAEALRQGTTLSTWASDLGCAGAGEVLQQNAVGIAATISLALLGTILVSIFFTSALTLALIQATYRTESRSNDAQPADNSRDALPDVRSELPEPDPDQN
ncbi:hypothetical protein [Lysobacter capsici]|uniref:hypothetical protein n=1 Tax=Lysobacter capsici TaxID=435897 RepID=UPI00128D6901|nr:hypothetical protein [Lysobacter capsici]WND82622.1 hypothetical protein RJ610_09860 [Lysobacter capsici]WND87819.1 hypothetical protein RJ609_09865 [Lysobacter capsici]